MQFQGDPIIMYAYWRGLMRLTRFAIFAVTFAASAHADVVYVSSLGTHQVLRYDAATGAFIDTFISVGSGGLNQPHGILERCDDILVASFGTDSVLRYDR